MTILRLLIFVVFFPALTDAFSGGDEYKVKRTVYVEVWSSNKSKCKRFPDRMDESKLKTRGSGYILGEGPAFYLISATHVVNPPFEKNNYNNRNCIYIVFERNSYAIQMFDYANPENTGSNPSSHSAELILTDSKNSDISIFKLEIPIDGINRINLEPQKPIKELSDSVNDDQYISAPNSVFYTGYLSKEFDDNYQKAVVLPLRSAELINHCSTGKARCTVYDSISRGYSGGPVFDNHGKLIGIVSTGTGDPNQNRGSFTPVFNIFHKIIKNRIHIRLNNIDIVYRVNFNFISTKFKKSTPYPEKLGIKSIYIKVNEMTEKESRPLSHNGVPLLDDIKTDEKKIKYNWEFSSKATINGQLYLAIEDLESSDTEFRSESGKISASIVDEYGHDDFKLSPGKATNLYIWSNRSLAHEIKAQTVDFLTKSFIPKLQRNKDQRNCLAKKDIQSLTICWYNALIKEDKREILKSRFSETILEKFNTVYELHDNSVDKAKVWKELIDSSVRLGLMCLADQAQAEKIKEIGSAAFLAANMNQIYYSDIQIACNMIKIANKNGGNIEGFYNVFSRTPEGNKITATSMVANNPKVAQPLLKVVNYVENPTSTSARRSAKTAIANPEVLNTLKSMDSRSINRAVRVLNTIR